MENIKSDPAVLFVYQKCSTCFKIYDSTNSPTTNPLCEDCISLRSAGTDCAEPQSPKKVRLKTLPSSGYSSLLPYQIPQVKDVLLKIFKSPPKTIIDVCAHIGGDSIHFGKLWHSAKITSIDIDPHAIKCLRVNTANAPNPGNFEIICADATKWIFSERRKADFYYFDPPWGGPSYCSEDEVLLYLSGISVIKLINFILTGDASSPPLSEKVILKVPRNFAFGKFEKLITRASRLEYFHIRKPKREGIIAYTLIFITTIPDP